jgi:hypothetical protein
VEAPQWLAALAHILGKYRASKGKQRGARPADADYRGNMNLRTHPAPAATEPSEREIQHAAYFLWEAAGRPAGRDLEFWFAARERLRHRAPARILAKPARSMARNAQPVETLIR